MFTKKPKQPVPMPAFLLAQPRASRGLQELYEKLRAGGEVHNTASCRLECELLLVRTYKTDPFRLALRVGGAWYELCNVRQNDPAVRALQEAGHIIEYGPPPAQIEKEQKRQAELQAQLEREQAFRRSRVELAERRIAAGEAKRRAALAARQ